MDAPTNNTDEPAPEMQAREFINQAMAAINAIVTPVCRLACAEQSREAIGFLPIFLVASVTPTDLVGTSIYTAESLTPEQIRTIFGNAMRIINERLDDQTFGFGQNGQPTSKPN